MGKVHKKLKEEDVRVGELTSELEKLMAQFPPNLSKFDHHEVCEYKEACKKSQKALSKESKTVKDLSGALNYMNRFYEK